MHQRRILSTADPVAPATERMLGLSDALFGIAITFLALDFGSALPKSVDEVDGYLVDEAPRYLVYVFAFLVVGFQWWRHHWIFRFIKRRTDALVLLNGTLLAFVALTPFGLEVLGGDVGGPVPLALFAGLMGCIGTLLWAIWEYAVRRRLTIPDLDPRIVRHMRIRLLTMPIAFIVVMGLAIAAEIVGWRHDGLALLLLLVLLGGVVDRRFDSPSVGVVEREIEDTVEVGDPGASRTVLARLRDGSHSERLTIFTDGVFAVAFTIMALRLAPPRGELRTGSDLVEVLSMNSSALIAYFITFYVLAGQWSRHVRLFERNVLADTGLLWMNLVLLMFVAFMPFATDLTTQPGGRTAVVLYLAILSATTFTLMAMEIYVGRRMASTEGDASDARRRHRTVRRIAVVLILVLAATLAVTMPAPEWGLYALLLFTVLDPIVQRVAPVSRPS